MTPEQIIAGGGSAGLILMLVLIARELWTDHKRRDIQVEEERDEAIALAKTAIESTAKISDGLGRLTRAFEKQATRRRAYDRDDTSERAG